MYRPSLVYKAEATLKREVCFPAGHFCQKLASVMFPGKHMYSLSGVLHVLVMVWCVTRDSVSADVEHTSGDKTLDSLHSTHVLHKRAPGWGKRGVNNLADDDGLSSILNWDNDDSEAIVSQAAMSKRAPGWGKRTSEWDKQNSESPLQDKRAPGWGKRNTFGLDKKAPGWGKRAPGWGKRAPGWGKRAPGWGKRAPGWGKRAPGWGKRSLNLECTTLDEEIRRLMTQALEVRYLTLY